MELDRLWEVTNFLESALQKYNFQGTYQNLLNILNQYKNNQRTQPVLQSITNSRNEIIARQNEIEFPEEWDYENYEIFLKIGGEKFIGKKAAKELEKIFSTFPANEVNAPNGLQNLLNELNQFRNKVSQTTNGLSGWKDIEISPQIRADETAIRLAFKNAAELKNIDDLKKCADDWQKIFNAFFRLENQPPEPARILNIRKGSIVFDIASYTVIVGVVARGAMEILKVIEKYLQLKKNALEIKNLELENKKLEQEIEKEADALLADKANRIAESFFVNNPKWTGKDFGEEKNAISLALRLISVFVENGGSIEFLKNEQAPTDEKNHSIFESIKKIEIKINETRLFLTGPKKN